MSATDEELRYVHASRWTTSRTSSASSDKSRRCPFSESRPHLDLTRGVAPLRMAFLYAFIVFLINLYSSSGRNAPGAAGSASAIDERAIELMSPRGSAKWYARVPTQGAGPRTHVLGDDDEEEEDMMAGPHLSIRR